MIVPGGSRYQSLIIVIALALSQILFEYLPTLGSSGSLGLIASVDSIGVS